MPKKPAVKPIKGSSAKAVKVLKPQIAEIMEATESMDLHELIAVEAYLLAEQRGFQGGDPVADWLGAEAIIEQTQHAGG